MRCLVFARRNVKELLRDPLSYIFCLGLPLLMLALFAVINESIPPETGNTTFRMPMLAPGIVMFGFTFVMLFASLLLSKDRTTTLLTRLFSSPMTAFDFLLGYTLPLLVIAVAQAIIAFAVAMVIGAYTGDTIAVGRALLCIVAELPCAVFFVAVGLIFGALLSDKGAPPCTSILITLAALMGGVWMPLEQMETLYNICKWFPFYRAVQLGRNIVTGEAHETGLALLVLCAWTVAAVVVAVLVFRHRMTQDPK